MKYTQNLRIMQVDEKTLVVGVDIAKQVHYARAFDNRGIELAKLVSFTNDAEGFKCFTEWVSTIKNKYKKEHVIVGMEPTGHYWFTFAQHLRDKQMKVVVVNPFHVKRSKELDDNTPTKNDRKDPKTIAMLMKDGRYSEPHVPEGIHSELRNVMDMRELLVKELSSISNRVDRWLCIYFPEFSRVFKDWTGKAALISLKEFPTPAKVIDMGEERIKARWKEEIKQGVGAKRVRELVAAAEESTGMREGLKTAELELKCLIQQYDLLTEQLSKVEVEIEEYGKQVLGVGEMVKITGVGMATAAGFAAEVGDILRFEHPAQIEKLAGLNLKENSSGKHKGKTTISKRGRKKLRKLLFRAVMPLVAKNEEFKALHEYYTTRAENPLKKKQSLIVLCCKLIRVFYVMMKKGVAYDPQKLMADIKRPAVLKAA